MLLAHKNCAYQVVRVYFIFLGYYMCTMPTVFIATGILYIPIMTILLSARTVYVCCAVSLDIGVG